MKVVYSAEQSVESKVARMAEKLVEKTAYTLDVQMAECLAERMVAMKVV